MTLGNKLTRFRKEHNYTQEQLAELMDVSRQSISKWESDIAYPETEKIIRLAKLFNVTTDYLLKDECEDTINNESDSRQGRRFNFERKSSRMVKGVPLWHFGKNAHGIIAIGLKAKGVVAVGLASNGIISCGLASFGVFSFGLISRFNLLNNGLSLEYWKDTSLKQMELSFSFSFLAFGISFISNGRYKSSRASSIEAF